MSVRTDLKRRLQSGETIVAPGAYDPMSARLVQSLGFDTIYTGGYMTGAHLAVTEPLTTLLNEVLSIARRHYLRLPSNLALLIKTLLMVEGLADRMLFSKHSVLH